MIGDSLMLIVLAIWVKDLTGSNGAAGLTFFFLAIPALVAPLFGMFVDRFKRRTLLFWGNLVSAFAVAPLFLVHDRDDVWIIYPVAFLYGISFIVLARRTQRTAQGDAAGRAAGRRQRVAVHQQGGAAPGRPADRGRPLHGVIGGGSVAMVDAASFVLAAIAVRCSRSPRSSRSARRRISATKCSPASVTSDATPSCCTR